jgi:hypothetical protein
MNPKCGQVLAAISGALRLANLLARTTDEAGYFGLAHASFERALSPFALLVVTT